MSSKPPPDPPEPSGTAATGPHCPSCGAVGDPGARFCKACGAGLQVPEALATEPPIEAPASHETTPLLTEPSEPMSEPGGEEPPPPTLEGAALPSEAPVPDDLSPASPDDTSVDTHTITRRWGRKHLLAGIGFVVALALVAAGVVVFLGRSSSSAVAQACAGSTPASATSATWTHQQTIAAPGSTVHFGNSVAISCDGNIAIVGAPETNSSQGSVAIYARAGSTWTLQQTIPSPASIDGQYFGTSVALSYGGNTAIVGASGTNNKTGSVSIITRSGSTWTQQGSIPDPASTAHDSFGRSVALSSDGNTALVGALGTNSNMGSVAIFTRSGSTWTQQGPSIPDPAGTAQDYFGSSVAISSDGATALVGALGTNSNMGSVAIFTRSGSTWTQQGPSIPDPAGTPNDVFGWSVALSADGNTAIVGASGINNKTGSVSIITRSGSTWTQQGPSITDPAATATDSFGASVALSSDGNMAIVGAPGCSCDAINTTGSIAIFTRSGTTWTQHGPSIADPGNNPGDDFGGSLALSSDGTTALVGASITNDSAGSVSIYTAPGSH